MKIATRYAPALALVVTAAIACYGPTQVTVTLSTDFACGEVAMASALFVGADASGDSAVGDQACRQEGAVGELGSIVLVPRADRAARFTLIGVLATWPNGGSPKDPRDCLVDPTACVVARRTLSFFEHDARSFDLRFYRACIGVRCQDTETCVPDALAGGTKCVSNDVDAPAPDPCLDPTACGVTTAVDAGPADAPIDPTDAVVTPTRCDGPAHDGVLREGVTRPTGATGSLSPLVVGGGYVDWLQGDQLVSVKTDGSAYREVDKIDGQLYFGGSLALGKNDVVWGIGHSHLVSVSGRDITPHDYPEANGLVAIRGDRAFSSTATSILSFDQATGVTSPPIVYLSSGAQPIVAMAVTDFNLFYATQTQLTRAGIARRFRPGYVRPVRRDGALCSRRWRRLRAEQQPALSLLVVHQ